jgi:gas vesicle GvpC-like protein
MKLHKFDGTFVGSSYFSILKCCFADQQKTMTFGVYPAVSLAKARQRRENTREWLAKTAAERMASTQSKITTWLEKDVIPHIGKMPISTIGPHDVLAALRKMKARGALDSVQRVKQICG